MQRIGITQPSWILRTPLSGSYALLGSKIFADLHNADSQGRIRLKTHGTHRDPRETRLALTDSTFMRLSDAELDSLGDAEFPPMRIYGSQSQWR
jgi:hypothetical protein